MRRSDKSLRVLEQMKVLRRKIESFLMEYIKT
jgi:hypothetical protein